MPTAADTIWDARLHPLHDAVQGVVRARVKRGGFGDPSAVAAARDRLAQVAGRVVALSNLLGREWLVRSLRVSPAQRRASCWHVVCVSQILRPQGRFVRIHDASAGATFWEAIDAILGRTPAVQTPYERIAEIIMRGGIAFARATDVFVAARVRDRIGDALRVGRTVDDAVAQIVDDTGWSRAYAETAYRTNAMTAYSDGQFQQAERMGDTVAGFEFNATLDRDVRLNHRKADGMVAQVRDPIWRRFKPPIGFNCRCDVAPLTRQEARQRFGEQGIPLRVTAPSGAFPDAGFRAGG